jgi:hypothetical protein
LSSTLATLQSKNLLALARSTALLMPARKSEDHSLESYTPISPS